ncbi:MAG: NTP transferase domain-containing protein [Bacteroidales bacterium]|nr:NTP transferase domain-containing protein [Bacteroidales bacterium]
MKPEHCGVIILAAGRSERMKEFKALLPFDGEVRFLDKILQTYSGWGCQEIVLVTNPEAFTEMKKLKMIPYKVKVVINDRLDLERFYSVKLGLSALTDADFCFLQNIDNPFIDETILDLIYRDRYSGAYISPVFSNKGGHPVLLNRQGIKTIYEWRDLAANLKDVLHTMEGRTVEMPNDRVLINMNSREDYERYI